MEQEYYILAPFKLNLLVILKDKFINKLVDIAIFLLFNNLHIKENWHLCRSILYINEGILRGYYE